MALRAILACASQHWCDVVRTCTDTHCFNAVDAVKFIETVLYNRCLPGRLFGDVGAAKAWLLRTHDLK